MHLASVFPVQLGHTKMTLNFYSACHVTMAGPHQTKGQYRRKHVQLVS